MSQPESINPAHVTEPLDADGHLDSDIDCINCGYNLRTLHPQHACPECGKPVIGSLTGDCLAYADPKWLKRVHWGTRLAWWSGVGILACVISMLLFSIVGFGGMYLFEQMTGLPDSSFYDAISWVILPLSTVAMSVMLFAFGLGPPVLAVGAWLICAVEPGALERKLPVVWRRVGRFFCYIAVLIWLVLVVLSFARPSVEATQPLILSMAITLLVVLSACAFVAHHLRCRLPRATSKVRTMRGRSTYNVVLACVVGAVVAHALGYDFDRIMNNHAAWMIPFGLIFGMGQMIAYLGPLAVIGYAVDEILQLRKGLNTMMAEQRSTVSREPLDTTL